MKSKAVLNRIRSIASKPLGVVAFRLYQAAFLNLYQLTGKWTVVAKNAEILVAARERISSAPVLFARVCINATAEQRAALKRTAEQVLTSKFSLFGAAVPPLEHCDFSADWRFQHCWAPQYFKRYSFYVNKQTPYDVKFPWELSRLHYLVPVLAWQLVDQTDNRTLAWVLSLLRRWRDSNPLAHSVNWYPMEASMRSIYLVMLLDLVKLIRAQQPDPESMNQLDKLSRQLLTMLLEHAHFVWRNIEYTDVRGNHFTANLVALQLADCALAAEHLGNRKWGSYAAKYLEREVLLQFLADGVNFEKSCGYHKLVLELFMLSAIAGSRFGHPFANNATTRLIAAARYCDAATRPDGLATGFGDTDDALGLPFLLDRPRSHGLVIELARAWFDVAVGNQTFDGPEQWAALFLAGKAAPHPVQATSPELLNFSEGGYVVVRNPNNGFYLMIDVGEVGMNGRGGHGHNDLLAFELCIDGKPIVIDPGCSGYTADLAKKTLFRSTAAHSTVQLYDDEIARFAGHWAILNDAVPCEVSVAATETGATIQAGHHGYEHIHSGARIIRVFEVDALGQRLVIRDEIDNHMPDTKVRWHFPTGELLPHLAPNQISLQHAPPSAVTVTASVQFGITRAPFSMGYGLEVEGNVITGLAHIGAGRHTFLTTFEPAAGL